MTIIAAYADPGRVLAVMMIPALAHGCRPGRAVPGGQRGHPDGDAAVAGQRLVHEVEAVGHGLAARPDRSGAAGARVDRPPGVTAAARAVIQQRDAHGDQRATNMAMTQPRTVRNLIHSARSSCPNPVAPGPGVRAGDGVMVAVASSSRPPVGWLGAVLDRVAGELQVGLLQGGAVRRHLRERHRLPR